MIAFWVRTSSAVVGSSSTTRRGDSSSPRAISTRCRIPPESWWGYEASTRVGSSITISRSSAIHASSFSPFGLPAWARAVSTKCCLTVSSGFSEFIAPWKTTDISVQRRARSASLERLVSFTVVPFFVSNEMLPEAMPPPLGSNPRIASASVVLPHPLSPARTSVSRGYKVRSMSLTAVDGRRFVV